MNALAFFDELVKLGAISDEEAQKSVDRLEALEKSKPTLGQMGRYGAVGALAAPAIGAVGNLVAGRPVFEGNNMVEKVRGVAGQAVKGGLGASVIPVARTALDRRAEVGHLKNYMKQEHIGDYAPDPGASTDASPPTGFNR